MSDAGDGAPGAIPVLVFHSVADRAGSDIWTLPTATFERHAWAVRDSGRASLTFAELAAHLTAGTAPPGPAVVVTFDDGFADNLAAAALCAEMGLRATFFITTDYIGMPEMVSPGQIRQLAEIPGVEVGSHTVSHRRLDELPRAEVAVELRDSRARLEDILGRPVTTVAYPHGNYDARVKALARAGGYLGAAAVRNALSHPADDPFAVARCIVTTQTTDSRVADVLAGRVAMAPSRERIVSRGYRWVRRARAVVSGSRPTPPVP